VCSSYSPYDQRYVKELSPEEYNIKVGDFAPDGSQYRPYIVWYGEAVPKIDEAIQYVQEADIFLIIGTSLNVYPAAGLLNYVPFKTPVYLVDPNEVTVNTNHHHIHVIRKVASEGMSEFVRLLTGQVNA
jgi:NAD-dependent deacetylase